MLDIGKPVREKLCKMTNERRYRDVERTTTEIDSALFEAARELAKARGRDDVRETIEALLEEAIRLRRFPGVAFHGPDGDRRAWLLGTPLDVWEIMEMHRDMGRELLLESGPLSERRLDLALAYYREYPEEIDEAIEENRKSPEYWHRKHPSVIPSAPRD